MAIEIERKFLVKGEEYKSLAFASLEIAQGYLSSVPERSVRIRITGDKGFITIKGISNGSGVSRFEWEKEIAVNEAHSLLKLCEPRIIHKIRHLVQVQNHLYEVDEFLGDNKGLIVAEIELKHEDEVFQIPSWLGEEVTGITKYYNASLSKYPYKDWGLND